MLFFLFYINIFLEYANIDYKYIFQQLLNRIKLILKYMLEQLQLISKIYIFE